MGGGCKGKNHTIFLGPIFPLSLVNSPIMGRALNGGGNRTINNPHSCRRRNIYKIQHYNFEEIYLALCADKIKKYLGGPIQPKSKPKSSGRQSKMIHLILFTINFRIWEPKKIATLPGLVSVKKSLIKHRIFGQIYMFCPKKRGFYHGRSMTYFFVCGGFILKRTK